VPSLTLVVLDGWGQAPDGPGNAISQASTPVFDELWSRYPHTTLSASGRDLRAVDWDREQVLALALGRMPGPGYSIRIDSVDRVGPTRVQVRYTVIQPPIGPLVEKISPERASHLAARFGP